MTIKDFQPYNKDCWSCCKRYYRDGVEFIPWMQQFQDVYLDDEEEIERWLNKFFVMELHKPWEDFLVYSPSPKERIEGFIYDGVRIKRTPDLNPEQYQEFLDIEDSMIHNPNRKGYVKEIWKYFFRETWRGIKTYTEHPDGKITVDKSPLSVAPRF